MKTRRNKALRICAGIGGLVIAAGLVLAADAITGDPLSRAWAEHRALAHAARLYPDRTFAVVNSYAGNGFSYGVTVQAAESPDTMFDVTTRFWLLTDDNADSMVENRHWTLVRQGLEGARQIADLLDAQCPQYARAPAYNGWLPGQTAESAESAAPCTVELDLCWTPEDPSGGAKTYIENFPLDAAFDPAVTAAVPDRLCAQILWDGTPAESDLQTVADAFDAALTGAGYDIDYYDLLLVPRGADHAQTQAMMVEGVIQK